MKPHVSNPSLRRLTQRLLSGALFVLVASAFVGSPAEAREWDSKEHNCLLVIPEDPVPWEWLAVDPSWATRGVIRGARRTVEKMKDGSSGVGYGGLLHLAKQDAAEGLTLDQAAADAANRKFMLARFGSAVSSLKVQVEDITLPGEHPAKALRVDGTLKGPGGKTAVPCRGVLILSIAKGKLYLLRMFAWHTKTDDEGIRADLDTIEYEGLEFFETKEEAKSGEEGAKPPNEGAKPGEDKEEEKLEEEFIEDLDQKWSITKHKKLKRVKLTKADYKANLVLKFETNDTAGWHQMIMYAIPNSRVINGQQAPAEDIRKGITTTWYKAFLKAHPIGNIYRVKWPRKIKAKTFITIPDLADEDARKLVFDEKRKKRDPDASVGDIMKKLGFVEKVKHGHIGKKFRASEAFRGVMQGNRERTGKETVIRFAWRTPAYSFRIIVSFSRDAYLKYGQPLRETLESLKIHKK